MNATEHKDGTLTAPFSNVETPRRPAIVMTLHWLTLVVLLPGVALILVREQFDGRVLRYWLLEDLIAYRATVK